MIVIITTMVIIIRKSLKNPPPLPLPVPEVPQVLQDHKAEPGRCLPGVTSVTSAWWVDHHSHHNEDDDWHKWNQTSWKPWKKSPELLYMTIPNLQKKLLSIEVDKKYQKTVKNLTNAPQLVIVAHGTDGCHQDLKFYLLVKFAGWLSLFGSLSLFYLFVCLLSFLVCLFFVCCFLTWSWPAPPTTRSIGKLNHPGYWDQNWNVFF